MQQPEVLDAMSPSSTNSVYYHNVCPKCGAEEITYVPEELTDMLTGGETRNYCENCRAEVERLEAIEREKRRRADWLERSEIPADFMAWDKSKGDNKLARLIHDNANKSLFICGKNAACKTRAAAINLKLEIAQNGKCCRFVRWSDLAAGYARICKMSSENSKEYIEKHLRYDVLLIDDVGKRRITETAGEMLYDMIDMVYSGESRTKIWLTANKTIADLANVFDNLDIGDAVVSRLDRMIESGKMLNIEVGTQR